MRLKYIKYILVKCFPSGFLDYAGFYFFNLIFSLIFMTNVPFLSQIVSNTYSTSYILFIPKDEENFEEKKDLIFSDLSLNVNIISVNQIQEKELLEKLRKKIRLEKSEEKLVPEVFEITIKKYKYLKLEKESSKLDNIIQGTKIIEKSRGLQGFNSKNYFSLFTSFFLFAATLIVLQVDYIRKLKKYLEKSRLFGVKDKDIIFNVVAGYLVFQLLGLFTGYAMIYFLENLYTTDTVITREYLFSIIIFFIVQNLAGSFNLVLNIKYSLRKFL